MLNELSLNQVTEGLGEERNYYDENQLVLKSEAIHFPTLRSFIECFLIPRLIGAEYEYLEDSVYDEWQESFEKPTFENWLQFSNKDLEGMKENLENDELANMIHYLQIKNNFLETNTELKGMEICSINAYVDGEGIGTELVHQYQEEVDYIILYPTEEAMSYWEKQSFKEWECYYYIWTKNTETLQMFNF